MALGNILDELGEVEGVRERLFPVGRLDKDSSGLILLTSDGGLTNTLLRAGERKQKEYLVTTHVPATDADIARLAAGVVITTVAQSDGRAKPLTARTRPCVVERDASPAQPARLRFVLEEGRNRQIRRMCAACGLDVIKLHRVGFAGITLANCGRPGAWTFLTDAELDVIMPGGAAAASGQQQQQQQQQKARPRRPRQRPRAKG